MVLLQVSSRAVSPVEKFRFFHLRSIRIDGHDVCNAKMTFYHRFLVRSCDRTGIKSQYLRSMPGQKFLNFVGSCCISGAELKFLHVPSRAVTFLLLFCGAIVFVGSWPSPQFLPTVFCLLLWSSNLAPPYYANHPLRFSATLVWINLCFFALLEYLQITS